MTDAEYAWVRALPKAELHVHLEGCIPLATVGLDPTDAEFRDLAGFLAYLDRSCRRVRDADQLQSIAAGVVERAAEGGVRHVDAIVNPAHWPAWRGRLGAMLDALDRGFAAAETEHDVTVALSVSLLRTQPEPDSRELVDWLVEHRPARVAALSIDGDEAAAGRSGPRFAPLFSRARAAGLRTCAHAGESSGPDGVRDALDLLGVERIDHGIRAVEDPDLVTELAERATPLDVCPTSNVRLGVVDSWPSHPVETLRLAGVAITINTDDPMIFGCDVLGEYLRGAATFGWSRADMLAIARTSIFASFAPEPRRRQLEDELAAYAARM